MNAATKSDYAWNTVGTIAQNAVSPLLLLAVTRINGIDASGLFSFAFAVSIVFWSIGMWGGRTFQTSDTKNMFTHQGYVAARLLLAGAMLSGALIFSLINHYEFTKLSLILVLVGFKATESIVDALYGVMQVHGYLRLSGKSLLYKASVGTVLFVLVDAVTNNLIYACCAILLVNLIILRLYDIPNVQRVEAISFKPSVITLFISQARSIVWQSFPVLIVSLLIMLPINIPRYFLDRYHPDELGYFGIVAMLVTVFALLVTFLLQPAVVSLSQLHARKDYAPLNRKITKLSFLIVGIGIISLPLTYFAGATVLKLLFGVDFSAYRSVLVITVVGGVANSLTMIFINILTIKRRFKAQLYILVGTTLCLAGLAASAVDWHRSLGAVIIFASTSCLQAILLILYYISKLRE